MTLAVSVFSAPKISTEPMASSGAVPHCRFWRLARPLFHVPMMVWSGPLSANSVSPLLLLKWKCGGHAWLTLSQSKLTSFSRDTDWSPPLSRACVHHWWITALCIKICKEMADKIKRLYGQRVAKEICTYQRWLQSQNIDWGKQEVHLSKEESVFVRKEKPERQISQCPTKCDINVNDWIRNSVLPPLLFLSCLTWCFITGLIHKAVHTCVLLTQMSITQSVSDMRFNLRGSN